MKKILYQYLGDHRNEFSFFLDQDFGIRKLKLLKNAMTKELDIPASIYEALFHWILFSSHALITAQMYSSHLRVSSFLNR